jgi:HlyD family secretion protein
MMSRTRMILAVLALAALVAAFAYALWPDPVPVDLAQARAAPMEVTVDAEGMTRVRNPFSVTAPLTGITTRSPVQVGDRVIADDTIVAVIRPAEPAFLDARARRQAEASVTEAEAAVSLAEVNLARAEADLAYAENQLERNRALAGRGVIPQRALEDTEQQRRSAQTAHEAARSELNLHRATLMRMQAQLTGPETSPLLNGEPGECCVQLRAPQSGTVLDVADQSARLVQAGSPLLSIGDLQDLEVEVDLLSSDAVRVVQGAAAYVERWGGSGTISARVRQVDPAAFTRVSALGIEEQRVRLRLDILSPPEERVGLGDRYRVFVRVVIWSGDEVLQIPQSALFRHDEGWAVFRAVEGRAVLTHVDIGQQRPETVQVLSGLEAGDTVVAFPGNRIADGVRIVSRDTF